MGEGTPVTGMSVSAGAGSVAHGVHYAILAVGLVGLLGLLAPVRFSGRHPRDDHSRRVADLRRALGAGAPSTTAVAVSPVHPGPDRLERAPGLWVPIAVVCTIAAGGAHAAVAPAHWNGQASFATFFTAAALGQAAWAAAMAVRGSSTLLRIGAAGNAALVVLWLLTRTVGLPGILPGPEAVGPWDLACAAWETVAVLACVRALRAPVVRQVVPWRHWDRRAQAACVLSGACLLLLSTSGAGS